MDWLWEPLNDPEFIFLVVFDLLLAFIALFGATDYLNTTNTTTRLSHLSDARACLVSVVVVYLSAYWRCRPPRFGIPRVKGWLDRLESVLFSVSASLVMMCLALLAGVPHSWFGTAGFIMLVLFFYSWIYFRTLSIDCYRMALWKAERAAQTAQTQHELELVDPLEE